MPEFNMLFQVPGMRKRTFYVPFSLPLAKKGYNFIIRIQTTKYKYKSQEVK